MHPKNHTSFLAIAICLFLLLPFACRKTDAPDRLKPDTVAEKFLALPATSPPEIVRVAEQLRRLNGKAGFLNQIAAQVGYPVWDKVIYHTATRANAGRTTGMDATGAGDTLLYLPLVPENARRVSAFILARLDGKIYLQLHQARDYARYGFGSLESATHNADRLALQLMVLDQQVFGYTEFTLLDHRLFHNNADSPSSTGSLVNRVLQLRPESEGTASLSSRSSAGHWEEGTITHCTRPEKGSGGGRNAVGAGNTSSAMSGPGWTCTTTVHYYFVPGDDEDGSGSPGTGGSSGGGGGGGTPPAGPQPCNATPELDNGLPPCPRSGEEGWIPRPPAPEDDKTPCEIAQEWARKMDTLYAACNADSAVATITDLATQPKEKGFPIFRKVYVSASATQDTIVKGYFAGEMHTGTDTSINYNFTHGLYEIPVANLHTHPPIGYWAQSAADVYDLIDHRRKDSRYMGAFVVSYNGNRYALTITDPAAADSFYRTKDAFLRGANWNEESTIGKALDVAFDYFSSKYQSDPDVDKFVYEFALAAVLKQYKAGVTLNKRDATGHFKPVIVNTVIPNINKPKKKEYIQDCL